MPGWYIFHAQQTRTGIVILPRLTKHSEVCLPIRAESWGQFLQPYFLNGTLGNHVLQLFIWKLYIFGISKRKDPVGYEQLVGAWSWNWMVFHELLSVLPVLLLLLNQEKGLDWDIRDAGQIEPCETACKFLSETHSPEERVSNSERSVWLPKILKKEKTVIQRMSQDRKILELNDLLKNVLLVDFFSYKPS